MNKKKQKHYIIQSPYDVYRSASCLNTVLYISEGFFFVVVKDVNYNFSSLNFMDQTGFGSSGGLHIQLAKSNGLIGSLLWSQWSQSIKKQWLSSFQMSTQSRWILSPPRKQRVDWELRVLLIAAAGVSRVFGCQRGEVAPGFRAVLNLHHRNGWMGYWATLF